METWRQFLFLLFFFLFYVWRTRVLSAYFAQIIAGEGLPRFIICTYRRWINRQHISGGSGVPIKERRTPVISAVDSCKAQDTRTVGSPAQRKPRDCFRVSFLIFFEKNELAAPDFARFDVRNASRLYRDTLKPPTTGLCASLSGKTKFNGIQAKSFRRSPSFPTGPPSKRDRFHPRVAEFPETMRFYLLAALLTQLAYHARAVPVQDFVYLTRGFFHASNGLQPSCQRYYKFFFLLPNFVFSDCCFVNAFFMLATKKKISNKQT